LRPAVSGYSVETGFNVPIVANRFIFIFVHSMTNIVIVVWTLLVPRHNVDRGCYCQTPVDAYTMSRQLSGYRFYISIKKL
jgi:hypothetical protein